MPFVGAWNSVLRIYEVVVCADARILVNVVPQLLLCGSVLSCPALGITVTLAVASVEVPTSDPIADKRPQQGDCFRVGVPLALSRE